MGDEGCWQRAACSWSCGPGGTSSQRGPALVFQASGYQGRRRYRGERSQSAAAQGMRVRLCCGSLREGNVREHGLFPCGLCASAAGKALS